MTSVHEKLEALHSNRMHESGVNDADSCIHDKDRQVSKHHADEMDRHEKLEKQVVDISDGLHVQKNADLFSRRVHHEATAQTEAESGG